MAMIVCGMRMAVIVCGMRMAVILSRMGMTMIVARVRVAVVVAWVRVAVMLQFNAAKASVGVQHEIHDYVKYNTAGRRRHHEFGIDINRIRVDATQHGQVDQHTREYPNHKCAE